MFRATLIAAALAMLAHSSEPHLMPWPAKLTPGTGALAIDHTFAIATSGCSDSRLQSAITRLRVRIGRMTGIQFAPTQHATLSVECRGAGAANPTLGEDESYRLEVTTAAARLTADTVTGALRGLETFAQLVTPSDQGFEVPAVQIEDRPRFAWRGLMIDVCRHWMPPAVIERNLDAMAAVKMNVFHWHLSDDQGFRVESQRFPKLQQVGSDGNFYTQAEIRHIIAYARDRGIRVIPEFDMPGHTTSWFVGMPELASAPGRYEIERAWGIFQPTMDPTREETYAFLDSFIGEMAALFPDPFFHIGGDEVDDTQWRRSDRIQAFQKEHGLKSSAELQAWFNSRLAAILKKHGKTMIGWDEVLNPGLSSDTVIQSWRGQQSLADAARKGHRGILSYGYYLDHLQPASFHYANDPLDGAARELDKVDAARILGGEACMWTEYVNPETVDSRIWPRAAAIAERLWSPASLKDINSMYVRMESVSRSLDWVGVEHRSYSHRLIEGPMLVLADAVEAQGIEGRQGARKYTSFVPLNRLVDAARPESEHVRALELAAGEIGKTFAAKSPAIAEIEVALAEWRDNHALLLPLSEHSEVVREALPISEELSTLGTIGLQVLKYIQSHQAAPANWIEEQRSLLKEFEKPKAEVTLAAVRPVRLLLDAVSRNATQ
jgi:hexosaminidase